MCVCVDRHRYLHKYDSGCCVCSSVLSLRASPVMSRVCRSPAKAPWDRAKVGSPLAGYLAIARAQLFPGVSEKGRGGLVGLTHGQFLN